MFDRILEIIQTVALLVLVSVVVWRRQNKPESGDISNKKSER